MTKIANMEKITDISWFSANILTLYVGLKAKFIVLTAIFGSIDITTVKNVITIVGGISSLIFTIYIFEKLCHVIMENKVYRKEHKNILKPKK